MRDAGVPVIGEFQTPMEKKCLRLPLRVTQPVVVCLARGIDNMRIPRDWPPALEDGRLLIVPLFKPDQRRPTAALAAQRNDLVAELASGIFVAHAAPGSKTEAFARKLAESGMPLLALGSRVVAPEGKDEFAGGRSLGRVSHGSTVTCPSNCTRLNLAFKPLQAW